MIHYYVRQRMYLIFVDALSRYERTAKHPVQYLEALSHQDLEVVHAVHALCHPFLQGQWIGYAQDHGTAGHIFNLHCGP